VLRRAPGIGLLESVAQGNNRATAVAIAATLNGFGSGSSFGGNRAERKSIYPNTGRMALREP